MPVKEEEIRVGNWFFLPCRSGEWTHRNDSVTKPSNFQWTSTDWYQVGECCMNLDFIDPIPISSDILEASGFVKNEDAGNWHSPEHTIYTFEHFSIGLKDDYFGWYNQSEDDFYSVFHPRFHFIHDLQNFYYAYRKQELNIKFP